MKQKQKPTVEELAEQARQDLQLLAPRKKPMPKKKPIYIYILRIRRTSVETTEEHYSTYKEALAAADVLETSLIARVSIKRTK